MRNLAELSRRMLGGDVRSKRITVLCGAGNNGGGMVAARHLNNWGADIGVPLQLYARLGINLPAIFHPDTIIKV